MKSGQCVGGAQVWALHLRSSRLFQVWAEGQGWEASLGRASRDKQGVRSGIGGGLGWLLEFSG